MKKLSVSLIFAALASIGTVSAQEALGEGFKSVDEGFNHQSAHPIHRSDIMWQKTIIRNIDLREKQNEPMFSKNKEITKIIIDAVRAGELKIWKNDSLDLGQPLTLEEFLKNIEIPSAEVQYSEEELAFLEAEQASESAWGEADGGEEESENEAVNAGTEYFFPKDLYQLQIKEDLIFDKQRSRMYHDVLSLTMIVPADHPDNIKGIEIPAGSFSYKELVNKVFKDNPDAIWYNPYNDAEHKNLAHAFELRLFSSYIVKVSNPNDDYLVDIYGGDLWTGIMASQWKSFELLEFEHNLWEF